MTTVTATFSIRSFRRSDDPQFIAALEIYSRSVHYQAKTDVREITYWVDNQNRHPYAKLYICGLLEGTQVIGYVQLASFQAHKLIHVDYFVVAEEHRSRGRFFLFAEQLTVFLRREHVNFDILTAEVSMVAESAEHPSYPQKLLRLFRSVGLGEVKVEYFQPMLGWGNDDTSVPAKLLLFAPVTISKIPVSRYVEILRTIYTEHYRAWYRPIYPDKDEAYRFHIDALLRNASDSVKHLKALDVEVCESEFIQTNAVPKISLLKRTLIFASKIIASAAAAALLHWLLKTRTQWTSGAILGVAASLFVVSVFLFTIKNRGQLEVIKFILTVIRDFLSH